MRWLWQERSKIIIAAVAAVTLGVLIYLLWPTIQGILGPGTYTPRRLWAAAIVAGAFFVIGLLVYFVANKTLWELAELLVVPLALAVIGFWFTMQQDTRQGEIEEQRAQDAALQAYFDQMNTLLLEEDLRNSEVDSEVRTLARARTLTVLGRLDPSRKPEAMQFLVEAELVQSEAALVTAEELAQSKALTYESPIPIISLTNADLRSISIEDAYLSGAELDYADLRRANLSGAILAGAVLANTNLSHATLRYAHLAGAVLAGANLSGAELDHADLRRAILSDAQLSDTDLRKADLRRADLRDVADLSEADLSGANLSRAKNIDYGQLAECKSLEGATMPNGQKYVDWLGTLKGQDWLRKYKKNLGAEKMREGVYDNWIKTTEGKMWLKAVGEDGEPTPAQQLPLQPTP